MLRTLNTGYLLLFLGIMAGCATTPPDNNRADYKKTATQSSLEIPPDLTLTTNDELILPDEIAKETVSVTEQVTVTSAPAASPPSAPKKIAVKREGNVRWLVIRDSTPESLWSKVRMFWLEQGFKLKLEDPKIGILETDWQENRADIPQTGLRKLFGGVLDALYSAPTRDKFRVRLERGDSTTEVYLTHRGAEEVNRGDTFIWQPRPADPELEAELLNRLMVFLGVEQGEASTLLATPTSTQFKAELVQTTAGIAGELVIYEDLLPAWQRVGVILDRLGFGIVERERAQGRYQVRYFGSEEEKGFLARWFGGSDDTEEQVYQIHLTAEQAKKTRLKISDLQGQIMTNKTTERILTLLYERLK